MKKLFILPVLLFAFDQLSAQTEQGRFRLGLGSDLNFSISTVENVDDNRTFFGLDASGGYFLADNFLVGFGFGFSVSEQGDFKNNYQVFGPHVRYYYKNFFAGGSISFTFEGSNSEFIDDRQAISYGFSLGYAYFVNDRIAIEPQLSYNRFGIDGGADFKNFGPSIAFGFYLP